MRTVVGFVWLMELIYVLGAIIFVIMLSLTILFCIMSIKIYIKECTVKSFLIWISSYASLVGFSYLIDSSSIQLYFSIFLISSMASIFFILRIEERSFDLKYLIGFLISITSLLFAIYLHNPVSFSFFREMNRLLFFIFIFYFPKIFIYNKLIKNKNIRYPLILIGIPTYLLFAASISGRFYEFLEFLCYYFLLIAFLSIIFFQEHIREWIRSVLGKHYKETGKEIYYIKKIKDIINNKLYYLFNWDIFTKDDSEKLREFLMCKFGIDWIKYAEICKIDDDTIKIINTTTKENSAKIIIDDKREKASLKFDDGRTYNLKVDVKDENGRLNIYKTSIKAIPIAPIEPSGHHLCDEIDDAIINDRYLNFEKANMQALRFMLVCANNRKETILAGLSTFRAFLFAAFALIIPPWIETLLLLFESVEKLQLEIIDGYLANFENLLSTFLEGLFQIHKLFTMTFIIVMILVPMFFREELFLWFRLLMKKYVIINLIYQAILGIVFVGFMIKAILSMEIASTNIILLLCSILCMIIGSIESKHLNKQLSRNYKIILNLNEKIIFEKDNQT